MLGGDAPADIKSLTERGYEIMHCRFGFRQGIDSNGKATTSVRGGMVEVALSRIPPDTIIEWALNSRKYIDAAIIILDADNVPVEKIFLNHAACTEFEMECTRSDNSYITVKLRITAEHMTVAGDITLTNNWIYD